MENENKKNWIIIIGIFNKKNQKINTHKNNLLKGLNLYIT